MVILEDSNVKLEFLPEIPAIIWKPLKYLSGDSWRIPFVTGMDFMEGKIKSIPNLGWINDTRLLNVVKPDDLMWLNANVNDRAYRFGAKKVAFVLPDSVFGRLAVSFYVDYTNKRMDNQFQIQSFKTFEEALKWIGS
jgi:hypothetical protein